MNEPLLRRFLRAALAGALLFGADTSLADPLEIVTGPTLPDATNQVAYHVQLAAENADGPVQWSIDSRSFDVRREPNSYAETGTAVLGGEAVADRFWKEFLGLAQRSSETIELPFPFPYRGGTTGYVTAFLDGILQICVGIEHSYGSESAETETVVTGFDRSTGTVLIRRDSHSASPSIEVVYRTTTISPCPFQGDPERTTLFVDRSVPGRIVFRWSGSGIGEYDGPNATPVPFNCSATLYEDGTIRYAYGEGNYDAAAVAGSSFAHKDLLSDSGMSFADDIVLEPVPGTFPPGLSFSSDGAISGTPYLPGLYSFNAIAADDLRTASRTFSILVRENPDRPPVIDSVFPTEETSRATSVYTPTNTPCQVSFVGEAMYPIGSPLTFSVAAHDPEGSPLSYAWSVDRVPVAEATSPVFVHTLTDADVPPPPDPNAYSPFSVSIQRISCLVTDGTWTTNAEWNVTVLSIADLSAFTNEAPRTTWYVDAAASGDASGTSWQDAFTNLQAAAESAESGDRVLVAPGVYSPMGDCFESIATNYVINSDSITTNITTNICYTSVSFADVELSSRDGPEATVIDGDGKMPCLGGIGSLVGFTLRNGAGGSPRGEPFSAATVERCIVSNCVFAGPLFSSSSFLNCLFVDNRFDGEDWYSSVLLEDCWLDNCILSANTVRHGLLLRGGCAFHCTVAENLATASDGAAIGGAARVLNSIVWNNFGPDGSLRNYATATEYRYGEENGGSGLVPQSPTFENCCLNGFHEAKEGLVFGDPLLAGAAYGDVRLREGSSCIDAGSMDWGCAETDFAGNPRVQGSAPDIGAMEGVTATGRVVSVRVRGLGGVSPRSALVGDGGAATFSALNNGRPFLGFYDETGSLLSSSSPWTIENVRADRTLVAVFGSTLYADSTTGVDDDDGLSRETPKRTIQSAIDSAIDGDEILVAPGIYGPFRTKGKRIRIVGEAGAAETIVDGDGTNRCALLFAPDDYWLNRKHAALSGLTLRNGGAERGGGAYGGELFDCVVSGNRATVSGGGLYDCNAVRCRIVGNKVEPEATETGSDGARWLKGGGTDRSTLVNCLVAGNGIVTTTNPTDRAVGGGISGRCAGNSTIVDNWIEGPGQWRGSGVGNSVLYGCILSGNDADGVSRDSYIGEPGDYLEVHSSFDGTDPGFVDPGSGDYRLRDDSPCIDAGEIGLRWEDEDNPLFDDRDLDGNPRLQGAAVDQGCYESSYKKTQTSTTPVPVPFAWLDSHYADLAVRGGYEERANSTAANGVDEIWKCFVTGVVPTDGDDRFLATIEMKDGEPGIGWTPDLNEGGTKSERVYTVEGKANLGDESWGPTNESTRFFRVKVSMP